MAIVTVDWKIRVTFYDVEGTKEEAVGFIDSLFQNGELEITIDTESIECPEYAVDSISTGTPKWWKQNIL
jgi:hypothetical protein